MPADGSVDTKARVELACGVLQTLPWPSGSFVMAAPPGVDPRSRGSEPRALPLSYGASRWSTRQDSNLHFQSGYL